MVGGIYNKIVCVSATAGGIYNAIFGGSSNAICSLYGITCQPTCFNAIMGGTTNCMISSTGPAMNNVWLGGASGILSRREKSAGMGKSITLAGVYAFGFGDTKTVVRNTFHFDTIEKTTNNFRIKHPDPEKCDTHMLVHSTVESPTAGDNVYRFDVTTVDGKAEVQLPDYFSHLNECPQAWTTPFDGHGHAFASFSQDMRTMRVRSQNDGKFHVLVVATRKDTAAVNFWRGAETIKPLER